MQDRFTPQCVCFCNPYIGFSIIFIDFEYSVECLCYEEFIFHSLRFCTVGAVILLTSLMCADQWAVTVKRYFTFFTV